MQRVVTSGFVAVACTLLAPACDGRACACVFPPPGVEGHFMGWIHSPDSVGIGGATVVTEVGAESCDVADERIHVQSAVSEHGGYYNGVGFATEFDTETLCIRVRALPPDSTPYAPSDYAYFELDELPELGPERVDLYLNE